jgi:type VI secretion system protein ImpF
MADLLSSVKIQPSLLDRLTDNEPSNPLESRDKRVLTPQQLRTIVLRDLAWLLNTPNLEANAAFEAFPDDLHDSVINFGIPDLAGMVLEGVDTAALVAGIERSLLRFEPRIDAKSLKISIKDTESRRLGIGLAIEIDGKVWADPVPVNLHLKTEVDLETGNFRVSEFG